MNILSVDIETTGLDPSYSQILEVGAVLYADFKKIDTFHCFIDNGRVIGEAYALHMNAWILKRIVDKDPEVIPVAAFATEFVHWAREIPKPITVIGKNFTGFDARFLEKHLNMKMFHRRVIDPAILYFEKGDEEVPGLTECMKRAGMDGIVPHNAVEDAELVMELFRRKVHGVESITAHS